MRAAEQARAYDYAPLSEQMLDAESVRSFDLWTCSMEEFVKFLARTEKGKEDSGWK